MSPLPLATPPARRRAGARRSRSRSREGGIAVALVVVLAVVAVPARGSSSDARLRARLLDARHAVAELRGAIADHRRDCGTWPGRWETAAADPHAALAADLLGGPAPYLGAVPTNPINGRADVRIVSGLGDRDRAAVTDGSAGWVYDIDTGRAWLDATGVVPAAAGAGAGDVRWMDL